MNGFVPDTAAIVRSYGIPQDEATRTNGTAQAQDVQTNSFFSAATNFNYSAPPLSLTLLSLAAAAQSSSSLAPRVRVETTEGDLIIEMDAVRAPLTSENFLRYVRDGAYDGTVFHRVIPNFVVQGGGFDGQLARRPPRAPVANESGNGLSNRRGTVGLAREDSPHSGSAHGSPRTAGQMPFPRVWIGLDSTNDPGLGVRAGGGSGNRGNNTGATLSISPWHELCHHSVRNFV